MGGRTLSPVPLLALCLAGLAASLLVSPHSPFAAAASRSAVAHAPVGAPDRATRVGGFPLPLPERAAPTGHLIAYARSGAVLRDAPFGRVVERLSGRTPFGSPQALAVVRRRSGRWLGVTTPDLGNGRLGWLDARAGGLSFARTRLEVDVDLSAHMALVRRGGHVLRRMTVGVGRPGSPTPTGRFAVTDKLDGSSYSAVYGCCILALSAKQTRLPAGWSGGDRIAIHGGPTGGAVSAGCIHAADADLRYLMRLVPLGTPVTIHA